MKRHFSTLAAYNCWANVRLYDMAAALPDELYRKSTGVYFKSLHGTLNHLLTADRIWMHRLEGKGDYPDRLDATIHDDLPSLREARVAEDQRIVNYIESLEDADFDKPCTYKMLSGRSLQQPVRDILAHLFNHQTHHRGQAHAALTVLGVAQPKPLDLMLMLME